MNDPTVLQDYFAGLRFYPQWQGTAVPVERVLAEAHKVYLRPDLVFDDREAIKCLKMLDVHKVRFGAENEIMSTSSHIYAPADSASPKLVSFKFHAEHDGQAPAAHVDCLLKPLKTMPMSGSAWIEILPEVQVLAPDHPDKELFQSMLLKRCDEQGLLFYDSKVEHRRKRDGVLHDENYRESPWPERSNIGLIPVIKDGAPVTDEAGRVILAPVVLDAGAVIPLVDSEGKSPNERIIQNLQRKDLTFGAVFQSISGYDYTQVEKRTRTVPSLSDYVSERAGRRIEVSYPEILGNYQALVEQMGQARSR